ncbi:hypothetical protein BU15DRAFT_76173 [Melanogaster broomeanus]|nr:hypothetical protein BU15DRAFT_76173 [Melanogaster broomeanus]
MSLAHRNRGGYVDYENVYGIKGVGIANAIINAQDAKRKNMPKKSRSMITLGHDPHNFGRIFSSPAPGLVMGVGLIGMQLAVYEECDTFLSTDAGLP